VNVDGTGLSRLVAVRGANPEGPHPAWSPDGRTIVFGRTASRKVNGLVAIRPDGSGFRALIRPRSGNHVDGFSFPAWSRDAKRLAFVHGDLWKRIRRAIEVADARGRHRHQIARLAFNPSFQGTLVGRRRGP
jgi:Tol biopolymer transport system component